MNPETLVTRMQFDTKAEAPKLFFKPMRWLTDEEYESSVRQGQTEDAKRAVTMTVAKMDKVAAPLALEGAKPKAKAAPKAEEPVAEEEENAPPTKRKSKSEEPATAGKPNLAKLAAQWDDE